MDLNRVKSLPSWRMTAPLRGASSLANQVWKRLT
jgi:hypothetical protein